MGSTNPSAIVDAMMTDLVATLTAESNAPKTQRKYAEPTSIMPEACPLLAVWSEITTYELITTTPAYNRTHRLMVAWYVTNTRQADTGGTGDPDTVHALDAIREDLVTRLAAYADGIPGIGGEQLVATVRSSELGPQAGVIWRCLIEVEAEEAA